MIWVCREKVVVPATKPYITFQGAGKDVTVIEWHDRASDPGPNGQQLRTYRTASVTVFANYFSARNISFKVRYEVDIEEREISRYITTNVCLLELTIQI